jgi:hypothetical protein
MSTLLSTTEAVSIDLVALRNWHFHCSLDKDRSPEMRRWHRGQVRIINAKIPRKGPGSLTLVKVCLIELLAGQARRATHAAVRCHQPFDWKSLCEAVLAGLEKAEPREPSNSLHKSFGYGSEDKATADSPQDAAASTSESSEAKA